MQEEETISNAEVFLLLHLHLPWLSPMLYILPEPRRLVGLRISFNDVVRMWGGRELRRLRWSLPPHIEITTPHYTTIFRVRPFQMHEYEKNFP